MNAEEQPARARNRTRVPDAEIAELRTVNFPTAMRGYEREAVDAYVSRVNQLIAELQITAAPESAIRHALEQVTDETKGLLERAHETADEITRRSRAQADDRLQRAEREAAEVRQAAEEDARQLRDGAEDYARSLRESAGQEARELRERAQREAREITEAGEDRLHELQADADAIWEERARLLDELRELLRGAGEAVEAGRARYPTRPVLRPRGADSEPEPATPAAAPEAEVRPT
jgi:DivIVA domain-containing protein